MSEFSFKPVTFTGIRTLSNSPVSASVHKCSQRRVTFRFNHEVCKQAKLSPGQHLQPFIDAKNRAILFLASTTSQSESSRKLYKTSGKSHNVDFPRSNEIADLFPGIQPATGLPLKECSAGRIVVTIPRPKLS